MISRRTVLAALSASALLAGCGFKLRGPFASPFQSLYIDLPVNDPFGVQLARYLKAQATGLVLVNRAQDAQVVFHLLKNERQRQVNLINNEGQVREYLLTLTITYNLTTPDGKEIKKPATLSTSSTLAYSEKTFLSQANEEELLYQNMNQSLIQRILDQLRAMAPIH